MTKKNMAKMGQHEGSEEVLSECSREIRVKVKVSPTRAMKAQRGKRCIALLILNLGIRRR